MNIFKKIFFYNNNYAEFQRNKFLVFLVFNFLFIVSFSFILTIFSIIYRDTGSFYDFELFGVIFTDILFHWSELGSEDKLSVLTFFIPFVTFFLLAFIVPVFLWFRKTWFLYKTNLIDSFVIVKYKFNFSQFLLRKIKATVHSDKIRAREDYILESIKGDVLSIRQIDTKSYYVTCLKNSDFNENIFKIKDIYKRNSILIHLLDPSSSESINILEFNENGMVFETFNRNYNMFFRNFTNNHNYDIFCNIFKSKYVNVDTDISSGKISVSVPTLSEIENIDFLKSISLFDSFTLKQKLKDNEFIVEKINEDITIKDLEYKEEIILKTLDYDNLLIFKHDNNCFKVVLFNNNVLDKGFFEINNKEIQNHFLINFLTTKLNHSLLKVLEVDKWNKSIIGFRTNSNYSLLSEEDITSFKNNFENFLSQYNIVIEHDDKNGYLYVKSKGIK